MSQQAYGLCLVSRERWIWAAVKVGVRWNTYRLIYSHVPQTMGSKTRGCENPVRTCVFHYKRLVLHPRMQQISLGSQATCDQSDDTYCWRLSNHQYVVEILLSYRILLILRIWDHNIGNLYYTILYYTILYYTILYYTILYYTILYYTILYYTILYYTILYYTILFYTILYCTILYYTILYYAMLCYAILY